VFGASSFCHHPLLNRSCCALADVRSAAVRWSIFAQFVAGETAECITPVVSKLASQKVHTILDFAAEEDLGKNYSPSEESCDHNVEIFLHSIDAAANQHKVPFVAGADLALIIDVMRSRRTILAWL
jgi:hypothetical protein